MREKAPCPARARAALARRPTLAPGARGCVGVGRARPGESGRAVGQLSAPLRCICLLIFQKKSGVFRMNHRHPQSRHTAHRGRFFSRLEVDSTMNQGSGISHFGRAAATLSQTASGALSASTLETTPAGE